MTSGKRTDHDDADSNRDSRSTGVPVGGSEDVIRVGRNMVTRTDQTGMQFTHELLDLVHDPTYRHLGNLEEQRKRPLPETHEELSKRRGALSDYLKGLRVAYETVVRDGRIDPERVEALDDIGARVSTEIELVDKKIAELENPDD